MGIYDRDYIREIPGNGSSAGRGPAAGFASMRMWSITTWLIIINCLFFVADHLLIPRSAWEPVEIELRLRADASTNFLHASDRATERLILDSRQPQHPFPRPLFDGSADPAVLNIAAEAWKKRSRGVEPTPIEQAAFEQVVVGTSTWQWMPPLKRWLHFSTSEGFLRVQFWRLIGFQFLHYDLTHLLFNMIGLFFFGPMVEQYLGRKRYLAFYLLAGICGALMYVALNVAGITVSALSNASISAPGLLFNDPRVPLVGASAGVFGVLMAGAYLAPNAIVLLFFFLPMRLRTLAYGLVLIAILTVIFGGNNAGGEAGHLGGAIAGYYFIRRPHHLHGFFDILGRVDPTSHHYRSRRAARGEAKLDAEIDRILIKIKEQGMDSLNARERALLRQESRRE